MEKLPNNHSEVFLTGQNIGYATATLKQIEKLGVSIALLDIKSRYLCDLFKLLERNDLRSEAARMGVRADIEKLMSIEDNHSIGDEVMHELKKTLTLEIHAGVHDQIHLKLSEFVGYVHEIGGDFIGALRFYADAYPEKYGDVSKHVQPSIGRDTSLIKKEFSFSEVEDYETGATLINEKFKKLINWLEAETSFMDIKPDEVFNRLLEEAITLLANVRIKE